MKQLTIKEKVNHSYIQNLLPKKGHLEFDFRDPKQYEYATMMIKKNFDTKRYPGLLKTLQLKKKMQLSNDSVLQPYNPSTENFQNMFGVSGLAIDSKAKVMGSKGVGTVLGGYKNLALTLIVTDSNNNLVASGQKSDVLGELLQVTTSPVGGGTTSTNVKAQLFYSGLDKNNNPISGVTPLTGYNAIADPVVTAPVAWCTTPYVPGAINIGLGRPWTDPELGTRLDYIWNEPVQSNPIGKIPFVGSVTFNAPISSPLALNQNILIQIIVANGTSGGASALSPADMNSVFNRFSIDPGDSKKLNWNLPGGTSVSNPGSPIVFSQIPWPTDILAYFNCQIIVQLTNGTWASANVISEPGGVDPDPLDGTAVIKPISFVWHCLGEKTMITMADGSKKLIANIIAGDKVMTDNKGGTALVEFTNKGAHIGSVLNIQTVDGFEIISSHNHVFMKGDLPSPASELKVGDSLQTLNGNKKITSIKKIDDYKGMFYNFSLATTSRSNKLGTFIGNGILVGDIKAQRTYKEVLRNDINWVKKQLPSFLHADVDSHFEEKALKINPILK